MSEVLVVLLVVALCAAFGLLHKKAEDASCSTTTSSDRCGQSGGCDSCELASADTESVR